MNDLSRVTSQFATTRAPRVSVVLPLHNAGRAISDRVAEVAVDSELAHINLVEIIVVDDGSSDLTWAALEAEARHEPRLRPIRLRRQFGPAAAREAGVLAAAGDLIITLEPDAPAADLGQFAALLEAGYDVVIGWRGDRPVKPSRFVGSLTGLHLRCPFSATAAFRREVLAALADAGVPLFSVPFAAKRLGYRIGEMEIAAPPRRNRRSEIMDFAALCGASVRQHANDRWLGFAVLAGTVMMAAAIIVSTFALVIGAGLGLGLSSLGVVLTGLGVFLSGFQLIALAMLGGVMRCEKGYSSRVNSQIAETLLRHVTPD